MLAYLCRQRGSQVVVVHVSCKSGLSSRGMALHAVGDVDDQWRIRLSPPWSSVGSEKKEVIRVSAKPAAITLRSDDKIR